MCGSLADTVFGACVTIDNPGFEWYYLQLHQPPEAVDGALQGRGDEVPCELSRMAPHDRARRCRNLKMEQCPLQLGHS